MAAKLTLPSLLVKSECDSGSLNRSSSRPPQDSFIDQEPIQDNVLAEMS